jgi:hypothetical protein
MWARRHYGQPVGDGIVFRRFSTVAKFRISRLAKAVCWVFERYQRKGQLGRSIAVPLGAQSRCHDDPGNRDFQKMHVGVNQVTSCWAM